MAGIKMTYAFDRNGVKWAADDYAKGMGAEPLNCERCDATVSHVGSFTRDCYDQPSRVRAFFRLQAKGEHGPHCRFGVDKQIVELAKTSDGLLESVQKNRYRMRLVAVKEELQASARRPKDDGDRKTTNASKRYSPSSGRLSAYINTAQRVLKLRALCDEDDDIEQHLELVFAGNTVVAWNQFYFEHARQMAAHQAVLQSTTRYPIAIQGRVGNVLNLQKLKVSQDLNEPTNGISLEVSVWSAKASWFDGLDKDDEVIVFGLWKAPTPTQTKATKEGFFKTYTNRRLTLTMAVKSQIAKI
jgi:hypothetical protein